MANLHYYTPILIVSVLFFFFKLDLLNACFFSLIYLWPQGMKKIDKKDERWKNKYKFSFIMMLYRLNSSVVTFFKKFSVWHLEKYALPTILCVSLKLLFGSGSLYIIPPALLMSSWLSKKHEQMFV